MGSVEPSYFYHRVLTADDGVVKVDGEMVDEPVRLRAHAILRAIEAGARRTRAHLPDDEMR